MRKSRTSQDDSRGNNNQGCHLYSLKKIIQIKKKYTEQHTRIHPKAEVCLEKGRAVALLCYPTFDAAAAVVERPDVALHAGRPSQLVLHQVRVVGARDEVVRQRQCHVLTHLPVATAKHVTLGGEQVPSETCRRRN